MGYQPKKYHYVSYSAINSDNWLLNRGCQEKSALSIHKKQLKALAKEASQGFNSEEDIAALNKVLCQSFYEKPFMPN